VSERFVAIGHAGDSGSGSEAGLDGNSLMEYSFVLEIRESISQPADVKEQYMFNIGEAFVLDIEGNQQRMSAILFVNASYHTLKDHLLQPHHVGVIFAARRV
jgi:RecA-family ATPase